MTTRSIKCPITPALRRSLAIALCAAAMSASLELPVAAQKKKPSPNAVATLLVADRTDANGNSLDGLTSDGAGPYLDAIVNAVSGEVRLDLAGTGRSLQVHLGTPETVAPDAVAPVNQIVTTSAVLFVQDIRSVPRGTTAVRVGRVGLGTGYPNHAVGFRYTTSQGIEIYGTPVCVSRRDEPGAIWDITSSCEIEPSDTTGLFEENLKGKINHKFKATYAVPFAFTVTCTASCPE